MLSNGLSEMSDEELVQIQISTLRHLLQSGAGDEGEQLRWCSRLVALRRQQLIAWPKKDEEVLIF